MRLSFPLRVFLLVYALISAALAQSPNGTISGLVLDPDHRGIVGADLLIVNDATGVKYSSKTNNEGIYVLPNLPPGPYRIQVSKIGFKALIKPDIVLNVQDALSINFTLPIGAFHETMTVEGGAPLVNTESAAVSTVVDRQFAENLPMNGRSFQTLIQLTPGVVAVPSILGDAGQFSVDGQRASSNYWMVDGVSANIGMSAYLDPGNGVGGALGSFSAFGGTNSLVSVDALQEFRIQTSTYAPEFGRTPGGQISIVTRSGTNQFHGTAFDYLRNDILDANDWFANANGLSKPEERQNDFGGTLGGPILKDRTFFFISYEGLRLRLPQVAETMVPSTTARASALTQIRPFFDAFPQPGATAPDVNGISPFAASYSNAATLDAYSLRIDHRLTKSLSIFGRYNYSPSELEQRGGTGAPLSDVSVGRITTQTATVGTTWMLSSFVTNDLRFNYSRTNGSSYNQLDGFMGAQPLTSLPFPDSFSSSNGQFLFDIFALAGGNLFVGKNIQNLQRQINVVDSLAVQKNSHTLKFGVDFRRLSPLISPRLYDQDAFFFTVAAAETGSLGFGDIASRSGTTLLFHNVGAFAQDTWRVGPRLAMTYGVRWDLDFSPSTAQGPNIAAVNNYGDLAALSLAPIGTPPFGTTYGNVAPRIGVTYQLSNREGREAVIRGGFGVFYDLATSEAGNLIGSGYPFFASNLSFGGTFPFPSAVSAPPAITPATLPTGALYAFDPRLKLPYTLQWNVAAEQSIGKQQSITLSYVGSVGRRLLQTQSISRPNPSFGSANLVGNTATSDYNALQVQFQRRLSAGLQALASYTLAHSIDTASAGSIGNYSNAFGPGSSTGNRGNSDFDIRHGFSAGVTYDIPRLKSHSIARALTNGWSLQNVIQVRSAPPLNVYNGKYGALSNSFLANVRPDAVPGHAYYVRGSQYPGGVILNAMAFTDPPLNSATNLPIRQGDLGRNALRGFGATQWDFAVHRDFPTHARVRVQFRAEIFNALNHPNFASPVSDLNNPQFGVSTQMLGRSLGGQNLGGGGFSPLYQIGGPRSIQLALKLMF